MNAFDYVAPENLQAGLQTLRESTGEEVRPLAGGTDLLPLMKARIVQPRLLVNLKRLAELPRGIDSDASGIRIGALATLADVEQHPLLGRDYAVLAQAAGSAATPQLRNMATVGGTLLQRPRCWYFRSPHFHCWLKGGETCHARDGENAFHAIFDTGPCQAVHPSDVACALAALDAAIEIVGSQGVREVPLHALMAPPAESRRVETTLQADEVVRAVALPPVQPGVRSIYLKSMDRAAWSFATVSCAAIVHMRADGVEDIRVVLGGVAAIPWPVTLAMQPLLGTRPDEAAIAAAARQALADAEPLRMNGYKIPLAEALVRSAVRTLTAPSAENP
jgi:xanthine dehydrogenase YagS FAD-binding subunit